MFDSLVFHGAVPEERLRPKPKQRSQGQLYVFALLESPMNTKQDLNSHGNYYNLTMNYR